MAKARTYSRADIEKTRTAEKRSSQKKIATIKKTGG